MLLTFFSKKTRFYQVIQKLKKMRANNTTLILVIGLLFSTTVSFAQLQKEDLNATHIVDINHANKFSKLVVQDFRGRMKLQRILKRKNLKSTKVFHNIKRLSH